ncbi:hypothetical protein CDD81_5213 [Ophiocordyceps australis]|uniref:AB hydrolase-1 domain-containing protein n=1 Tax=Ophiocordyceps australis TaxID=1399860 RepID=A0A2C5YIY5_9HYPO|nr:hypothetical protein CDD81_5213 [Ophiocordyceps australis]
MRLLSISALIVLAALAAAQSDPELSNATRSAFEDAQASDSASWVSQNVTNDPFYAIPKDGFSAAPGTLLRWQDIPDFQLSSNWTIPAGLSLSRFLFMSQDRDGNPVPVSGYVLLPYSRITTAATCNEKEPLKTIVFAHGTAGNIPNCAPSNQKSLYYGWLAPLSLASQGFAVIAPDYAGLGTSIPNGLRYLDGQLHSGDVAYALIAARASPIAQLLSHEWLVVGHSEGGMTAWRVNERMAMANQTKVRDAAGELLGAVSAAPPVAGYASQLTARLLSKTGEPNNPYPFLIFQEISKVFPNEIKLEDYMTNLALARVPLANKGCIDTANALYGDLTTEQIFKNTSWVDLALVREWASMAFLVGSYELAAPMLVLAGEADANTRISLDAAINTACSKFPKSQLLTHTYPRLGHDESFEASKASMFQWIRDRFNRVPVKEGCSQIKIEPLTQNYGTRAIDWIGVV